MKSNNDWLLKVQFNFEIRIKLMLYVDWLISSVLTLGVNICSVRVPSLLVWWRHYYYYAAAL